MSSPTNGAVQAALTVLQSARPVDKVKAVFDMDIKWRETGNVGVAIPSVPGNPARPLKPELVDPNKVPRRRLGSEKGRAALLHAIAHIELNAIDLACDMIARFTYNTVIEESCRVDFITDWISVAHDEARHFDMLAKRLNDLGCDYGDFPAHNGLWEAAQNTKDNIAARLAIAPLVLEARGLDVTPQIIKKLTNVNDSESVVILDVIYREEIRHVFIGSKWYHYVAEKQKKDAESYFKELVGTYFKGVLKPPFNRLARNMAELPESYYAT